MENTTKLYQKTFLRVLNKRRDIPCSWVMRLSIGKMSILHQINVEIQCNSSQTPKKLLWGTEQAEYKLYEEMKRASLAMKTKGTVTSTSSIGKSHPRVRQRSKMQKGMHIIPFIYSSKPHSSKENQTVLFRDAHTPSCKGKQGNNDGTGQNRGGCDHQRHGGAPGAAKLGY